MGQRMPEPLLTPEQVAEYLALSSVKVLYGWRYQGCGPPAYRIGKHLRYSEDELRKWLATQRSGGRG